MQDQPDATTILKHAIAHLRQAVLPTVTDRAAFDLRVCLSALELVSRELAIDPMAVETEAEQLRTLLGASERNLSTLNQMLVERIESGTLGADCIELIEHLYRSTMAKLAVDQPNYSSYKRHAASETKT
jgi:Domain of unknown function (DUF6285)